VKTLELNRTFLKKPLSGIAILFVIVLMYEALGWAMNPNFQLSMFSHLDGFLGYLFNWIFGLYLPELVSLYIILVLINKFHTQFGLQELVLTPKSILVYELKFLPLFLSAYFFFIPITLHLRYLLREFPVYSPERYQKQYLIFLYTFEGYITYTPFVVILGYILLNTSLVLDFLSNLRKAVSPTESVFSAFASFAAGTPRPPLKLIEAKMHTGDTLLNVEDCYLFETEGGEYFVEHSKGRFNISKSLAELENELDPNRFFRGNRNYILNLDFFDSYAYWEKGKYILYSRMLPGKQLIMPRARMQNLKDSLALNLTSPSTDNDLSTTASTLGQQVIP
jgi:two-component system, LytTR family, response regulator